MLNNYFTLKAQADYLNSEVRGSVIKSILTPQKNKIAVIVERADRTESCIFISLENNHETLFLDEKFALPKNNVFYFFEGKCGNSIDSLDVPDYERIISIRISDGTELIFTAIPGKSNFFAVKDGVIEDAFRESGKYKSELFASAFGLNKNLPQFSGYKDEKELKKGLSFFGKYYLNDFISRVKSMNIQHHDVPENSVKEYIGILVSRRKYLLYNSDTNYLCSLKELDLSGWNVSEYPDSNSLVRDCYRKSLSVSAVKEVRKSLLSEIDAKISRTEKKISNLKSNVENPEDREKFKHYGDLILANLNIIKKGNKLAEVVDYTSGGKLKIKLNESLTPSENADYYYSKYKGYNKSVDVILEKIRKYEAELSVLIKRREGILSEDNPKKLSKMDKKETTEKESFELPFRIFKLQDNYEVWVGKSSASNDLLTMKYARQYDLWFHVRGASGSHTVLRLPDKNSAPGRDAVKTAASIAAYYSKARKGKNVPVAYCERKYVKKRKGMNQGAVIMEKEKVIFVDPALSE